MALDLESDRLLTFAEAGRLLRPDRPLHPSTLSRWMKGVRGQKLSTTLVGGRRYVRLSQLRGFIAALSGGEDPPSSSPTEQRSPAQCGRINAARAELAAAGI